MQTDATSWRHVWPIPGLDERITQRCIEDGIDSAGAAYDAIVKRGYVYHERLSAALLRLVAADAKSEKTPSSVSCRLQRLADARHKAIKLRGEHAVLARRTQLAAMALHEAEGQEGLALSEFDPGQVEIPGARNTVMLKQTIWHLADAIHCCVEGSEFQVLAIVNGCPLIRTEGGEALLLECGYRYA